VNRAILVLLFIVADACCAGDWLDNSLQRGLLLKASHLERSNPWQAAQLYCVGAREGSTEAQFRLAMLFAFGQGVPEDRAIAASLLAIAAQQGHLQAMNMLETIRYSAEKLPACVLTRVDPPHAFHSNPQFFAKNDSLSDKLANLPKSRRWLVDMIKSIAQWHDVDPQLALSIVSVESNFQTHAQSTAHAMGLMQLIPATAQRFNVKDAFDASENVKGGVRYLRWLLDRYRGNIELVAAAYNAGEGAVDKYNGIPPYKETQDYVKRVLRYCPRFKLL
jgi:soluble lytic murein transglycosylase-like protein